MKFGVFDHLDRRDEPIAQLFDERLEMVACYDEAGFYSYHIAEHHTTPLGMGPSPNLFLAAVARETTRLRMGPMVYLLPLYHPLRLIEEVCMIDHLSNGRLDLGVGRGISPYEMGAYGVAPDDRREMFEEGLDVLLKGLTSERLSHSGKWYTLDDVPMEMRPLQTPYPPLWYGGANDSGAEFAARFGMNFVTMGADQRVKKIVATFVAAWDDASDAPERARSPVAEPLYGVGRHLFIADTDEEAERLARPAYEHWFDAVAKLWRDHGTAPVTGMLIDSYDEAVQLGVAVVGGPESVREKLAAQAADIGFNYLVLQIAWGSFSHAQEMHSLELFVAEVMPALKDG